MTRPERRAPRVDPDRVRTVEIKRQTIREIHEDWQAEIGARDAAQAAVDAAAQAAAGVGP